MTRHLAAPLVLLALLVAGACASPPPPRQYVLQGQIVEVHADRLALTIRHDAIPDFMNAMTMTFPVAERRLMEGRSPGELITATLEVENAVGRLVSITHTGSAPLPEPGTAQLLIPGAELPDIALVDAQNRRRSLAEWRGAPLVLTFTDPRCAAREPCGALDRRMLDLQRVSAETAPSVQLVTVALSEVPLTAEALAGIAKDRGSLAGRWTVLTGDVVSLQRLAGRFGVALPGSTAGVPAERTAVVASDGRIVAIQEGHAWSPSDLLATLPVESSR